MKKNHRADRLAGEISKVLAEAFLGGIKDPALGLVTITDVEVTRDLSHAKVYISNLEGEDKAEESLAVLEKAKGYLRSEIGRQVSLRIVPELSFALDTSLSHSLKINSILKDLEGKSNEPKGE